MILAPKSSSVISYFEGLEQGEYGPYSA